MRWQWSHPKGGSVTTINAAVVDVANRLMKQGRFNVADVVSLVRVRYPQVVAAHERALVDQSIQRTAKAWLRSLEGDEDEPDVDMPMLPLGLPRAIAVPSADGYYYVATEHATWAELMAGREERHENVDRAEKALKRYDAELARVQPLMEDDPQLTYGEACALLEEVEDE